ncbi:MAG TPA: hypothetical protein VMV35_05975 [Halothiobacillus sp.]|nr:hypothetical protein [Halothiobacillus sp.]
MTHELIPLLEPLIGQVFQIDGRRGTLIDVLVDPPALVLRDPCETAEVRLDYLGRPQATAVPTWTLSLYGESGNVLHPDLQRQLEPELAAKLNNILNN